MLALIDGDIVTHRVGYTTEEDSVGIAKYRADEMIDGILRDVEATEFRLFLSDSAENNFRYKIDPTYKANRVAPKPRHLEDLKEHLIVKWGAKIAHGMEADDFLGIYQDKIGDGMLDENGVETWGTVIASIDKDLLQIPGMHYNFVKKAQTYVSKEEGLLSFYRSILIGDVSDNIKGVYGIGPARAAKILPKWVDEETAIKAIVSTYMVGLYVDRFGPKNPNQVYLGLENEAKEIVRRNGQLLKIKQSEEEPIWASKWLDQMEKQPSPSIPKMEVASNPSTEPTTPVMKSSAG